MLGWGSATASAYYVCNDSDSFVLEEVRFEGNKSISMNQGKIVLRAGGAQTWNIGTNNTMKFNAPIGGDEALTITGGGAVELNADGTHAGVMSLDQGTFTITAGNALGASSRAVNYYYDRVSLTFDGNLTVGTPIDGTYLSAQNTSAGGLKVTAGSDVVFAGRIYNYTRMWVNVGAGGTKLYGTFGAPGSGADNQYSWISGTGLMRVLPKGTTIIFR